MLTRRREQRGHSRIPEIVDRVNCPNHKAERGVPCFHIKADSKPFGYLPAICNRRAERAGFLIPTQEQKDERRRAANRRG